jgi:hypothetical protein
MFDVRLEDGFLRGQASGESQAHEDHKRGSITGLSDVPCRYLPTGEYV